MTDNFVAVVIVLLPICGIMCLGMPYLYIFDEEVVPLLETMTEEWV